jgi:uncharacterized protein (TIGR00251 family)
VKFAVVVKPNSRKSEVLRLESGDFRILVKSPALEGKANSEAIGLIARYFAVSKSAVNIVKGGRGKQKLVEISRR